jgi:hypothetical protein
MSLARWLRFERLKELDLDFDDLCDFAQVFGQSRAFSEYGTPIDARISARVSSPLPSTITPGREA